ncbi:NAD(P)-binding protein [Mycobacterium sp. CVI_P3]|uniref:NAD(P)-binding protein n=1 Tax=Mycobacterium pinniadriaticum TaxID=2994102 RepID=A0ABT3SAR3_9MYCO|nr:NAD(P)-binding protein [Mycobacterium pinniadriaticum]MCX2930354.1 NAD(P)-binding protein [Mycobacterium pinniadriaticum]MCX2936584.1 NAD(P)-binding protein [Mycobacterium pinniadriaticum]
MARAATPRVGIIGAGMSGLGMAIKLHDAGIDSFVIYEKADDVGGTWRDNTYPGLHRDIPSPFYGYSFFPNAEWSRMLPPGGEIQAYLCRVADECDVLVTATGFLRVPRVPDIPGQSLVPVAEDQADCAMWWIERIRAGRVASAAPTEAAADEYNEDIKAALPQTIWASGCNSWYIFPWHPGRRRELLRAPVVTDFEVRTA